MFIQQYNYADWLSTFDGALFFKILNLHIYTQEQ